MDNTTRLNRIGEQKLTPTQKRKIRKLANGTATQVETAVTQFDGKKLKQATTSYDVMPMSAEQIASVLDLPVDLVEAELVERERGIDVGQIFRRQMGDQPVGTKERWAELFAAKDRDALVLQAAAIVRRFNASTFPSIKADVEMYALQRAIVAIDVMLANPGENPSAYVYEAITRAIWGARKGKAREFVSTNVRTREPKKRTNKELEAKLRQTGLSESMIESELFSQGFQPCGRTKSVETQWPQLDGASADFASHASGKRRKQQHQHDGSTAASAIESFSPDSEDWDLLETILSQEQCDYLRLRAAEFTREEIYERFQVSVAEQDRIMQNIRKRIADHSRQHRN